MKVSFDFDNTLEIPSVTEYAKLLIEKNIDIWVVTNRFETQENDDLYSLVDQLQINRNQIIFMGLKPKYLFFKENDDFVWHLDDSLSDKREINEFTNVEAITWFGNRNWQVDCSKKLLENGVG